MRKTMLGLIVGAVALCSAPALAAEHSIGQPVIIDGMIIHPVYLQPVHMAPMLPGMNESPSSTLISKPTSTPTRATSRASIRAAGFRI